MPAGSKPALPQQSSLQEFWNGKGKGKGKANAENLPSKSIATSAAAREETPAAETHQASPKRKKPPSSPKRAGDPATSQKAKRRRVVDSDEEIDDAAGKASTSRLSNLAPSSDVDIPQSEPAAASDDAETLDEGEDEVMTDEEIEKVTSKAATKNAQWATSKIDEVDIPGGWKVGDAIPYRALAKTFSLIEATTKRIEKTSFLTSFLLLVIQRSKPYESQGLLQAIYLCINRLSPDYVGIELGIGESILMKAIAESTGRAMPTLKADLKKEGDLGLVALSSKKGQKTLFKPKALTLPQVFNDLKTIALSAGHASQSKKVSIITKLLAACQDNEAKYIVRSLEGKLRIGNAERSVLMALAHAFVLAEKERDHKKWGDDKLAKRLEEATGVVNSVYSELPSYDRIIPALVEVGIDGLRSRCSLSPGIPLKPMLAKPTKAIGEVLNRFENELFTCEYKYDGERAQVHRREDGTIGVFSRNSEDMSKKYPDLVEQLPRCVKDTTKSFVLDCEAVAINPKTGKLLPFQELSRRKRKDVKVEDITVKVSLFAFDLLYLNGESLLHKTLKERRELLREHFQTVEGEFAFAKSSDGSSTEEIQNFLEESVKDGCEGLMVKILQTEASYYEPSRRSVNWLKLKKDYLDGIGDSLDLVVVGAYYGKGKRTNFYGAFLLACYDADSEEYQTICKIGTGFSEEALQAHHTTLQPLEMEKVRRDVKVGGAKPDVWLEPKVVWEVLTADLSLSPIYTAAQGLIDDRGVSLRFPRFIRVRDDKDADDATGPQQIAEMYERQSLAQTENKKRRKGGDDADGFW